MERLNINILGLCETSSALVKMKRKKAARTIETKYRLMGTLSNNQDDEPDN